jgi:hypothetical protein
VKYFFDLGDQFLAFDAKFFGFEFLFGHLFLLVLDTHGSATAMRTRVHPTVALLDGWRQVLPPEPYYPTNSKSTGGYVSSPSR